MHDAFHKILSCKSHINFKVIHVSENVSDITPIYNIVSHFCPRSLYFQYFKTVLPKLGCLGLPEGSRDLLINAHPVVCNTFFVIFVSLRHSIICVLPWLNVHFILVDAVRCKGSLFHFTWVHAEGVHAESEFGKPCSNIVYKLC